MFIYTFIIHIVNYFIFIQNYSTGRTNPYLTKLPSVLSSISSTYMTQFSSLSHMMCSAVLSHINFSIFSSNKFRSSGPTFSDFGASFNFRFYIKVLIKFHRKNFRKIPAVSSDISRRNSVKFAMKLSDFRHHKVSENGAWFRSDFELVLLSKIMEILSSKTR